MLRIDMERGDAVPPSVSSGGLVAGKASQEDLPPHLISTHSDELHDRMMSESELLAADDDETEESEMLEALQREELEEKSERHYLRTWTIVAIGILFLSVFAALAVVFLGG